MTDSIYAALESKFPAIAAKKAEVAEAGRKSTEARDLWCKLMGELHALENDLVLESDRIISALTSDPGAQKTEAAP